MSSVSGSVSLATSVNYQELLQEVPAFFDSSQIATLANVSALLFDRIPDLNWVGFYLWDGQELVLGPFQGKPACVRIKAGRGVCGTAFQKRESLMVADVDQFPGHIVCDSRSRSELVIPLLDPGGGEAFGVLDLDSESLGRFCENDLRGLTEIAKKLGLHLSSI